MFKISLTLSVTFLILSVLIYVFGACFGIKNKNTKKISDAFMAVSFFSALGMPVWMVISIWK